MSKSPSQWHSFSAEYHNLVSRRRQVAAVFKKNTAGSSLRRLGANGRPVIRRGEDAHRVRLGVASVTRMRASSSLPDRILLIRGPMMEANDAPLHRPSTMAQCHHALRCPPRLEVPNGAHLSTRRSTVGASRSALKQLHVNPLKTKRFLLAD